MDHNKAVRRFACPRQGCLKDFSRRLILNDHLRAHDNERPHECAECGRKFTRANDLRRHNAGHTRTKRHVCEGCKRTFSRKHALVEHLRSPKHSRCSQALDRFHAANTTSTASEVLRQSDNISATETSSTNQSHDGALVSSWTYGRSQQPSQQGYSTTVANISSSLETTFALPDIFQERLDSEGITWLPILANAQEIQFQPLPTMGMPENTLFPNPSLCPPPELSSGIQDLSSLNQFTLPMEKPIICGICQRRHDQKTVYRDHVQMHLEDLESRPYRCTHCGISFGWSAALFVHQTQKGCPQLKCSKVFSTHEALGCHLKGQDGTNSCHLAIEKSEEALKGWLKQKLDSLTKEIGVSLEVIWEEMEDVVW